MTLKILKTDQGLQFYLVTVDHMDTEKKMFFEELSTTRNYLNYVIICK